VVVISDGLKLSALHGYGREEEGIGSSGVSGRYGVKD
jgi:hypothetical protein